MWREGRKATLQGSLSQNILKMELECCVSTVKAPVVNTRDCSVCSGFRDFVSFFVINLGTRKTDPQIPAIPDPPALVDPLPLSLSPSLSRTFQEASELPVSGQMDDATRARMKQPRCGLEDPFNQRSLKYLLLGED